MACLAGLASGLLRSGFRRLLAGKVVARDHSGQRWDGRVAVFWMPEFRIGVLFWMRPRLRSPTSAEQVAFMGHWLAGVERYFQGRVCNQSRAAPS